MVNLAVQSGQHGVVSAGMSFKDGAYEPVITGAALTMNQLRIRLAWPLLACLALAACHGGMGPTALDMEANRDGITARDMLGQAMAEARRWAPDAELVVVTTSLAEGPRHLFWFYDVQSRSTGTCTRIRVLADGEVENVGTGGRCALRVPIAENFVDSPFVWQAVRDAGFRHGGDTVQFGLQFQRDDVLPAPRECWVVSSRADIDEAAGLIRGWCADPVSGDFVTRLSGKGGSVRLP